MKLLLTAVLQLVHRLDTSLLQIRLVDKLCLLNQLILIRLEYFSDLK